MNQSKIESFIEASCNNISGLIISFFVWSLCLVPLIKYEYIALEDSHIIVSIFFCVSYIRSYYWRRFFAKNLHKKIHKLFGNK